MDGRWRRVQTVLNILISTRVYTICIQNAIHDVCLCSDDVGDECSVLLLVSVYVCTMHFAQPETR